MQMDDFGLTVAARERLHRICGLTKHWTATASANES
jgi:hypothetical protein